MSWFRFGKKHNKTTTPIYPYAEMDNSGSFFFFEKLLNGNINGYSGDNSYNIALSLAEVFNPIDIISDRVAGVRYFVSDLNGKEIENLPTNLKRLMEKPNPFQNLSELVYQAQFIQLSTGGSIMYPAIADSLQNKTEYIANIWNLDPNVTCVKIKKQLPINIFLIKDYSEIVNKYVVDYGQTPKLEIPSDKAIYFVTNQYDWQNFAPVSPLASVERNINNLFAVYSARYNVYENNGSAGILSRKTAVDADLAQFEGDTRQKMLDEMNRKDGLTGARNFIGISSYPLEFIRTIGTIRELEPFTETKVDHLAIAGAYGVSKHLLPNDEGTTFANQRDAEKHLWQNTVKPYAEDMAKKLSRVLMLDPLKQKISCDFSGVEVLQVDRKLAVEADLLELQLYRELKEQGVDNQNLLEKWKN